jgi:predicted nucleic acid-binding Zn ribbon protein
LPFHAAASIAVSRCRFPPPFGGPKPAHATIRPVKAKAKTQKKTKISHKKAKIMKCEQCGAELDLLEVVESGQVFECGECACIIMTKRGYAPRVVFNGPPPLDYYFHD